MIRLGDLRIDARDFGDTFLLTGIFPDYKYEEGKRTEERVGTRYEVAMPALGLEKMRIKVPGPQSIEDKALEGKNFCQVAFNGLEARFYQMDGRVGISASAKAASVKGN